MQEISGSNAYSGHGRDSCMNSWIIIFYFPLFFNMWLNFWCTEQLNSQIYINMDDSSENYWLRLLVREWAIFCIFLYIGYVMIPFISDICLTYLWAFLEMKCTRNHWLFWSLDIFFPCRWTFRSQDLAPRFSVMPALKSTGQIMIPPIYSIVSLIADDFYPIFNRDQILVWWFMCRGKLLIWDHKLQEMDAATFKDISSHKWHIGVVRELKLDIFCGRLCFSTLRATHILWFLTRTL